jgi:MGT family glycosyltransferase
MADRSVVFFLMDQEGHVRRALPLIAQLSRRGLTVWVFAADRFAADVTSAGGKLVDMLGRYPLEQADDRSHPYPSRFVTYAAHFGADIIREVQDLRPGLIVYDTFAVIGRVVARTLGLPYVNLCAGHNMDPDKALAALAEDPRVDLSDRCTAAVKRLRDEFGLEDASPFSYVAGLSPYLNVYCEPSAYLTPQERRVFEPIAFFGSLPSHDRLATIAASAGPAYFPRSTTKVSIYVSFGTVVWRYWAPQALNALRAIVQAVTRSSDAHAVISLGRAQVDAESIRSVEGPSIDIFDYVDQWAVLSEADVFVTHHGLNSTHESINMQVPMISYPFFADQPSLAAKCQTFDLAVPLGESPIADITSEDFDVAFAAFQGGRDRLQKGLARAREWELEVIADRASVAERLEDLI